MPTRETYARIYQGEISQNEYNELEGAARGEGIPLREFILEEIRKYLKNRNLTYTLDIEEVAMEDGRTRFYLWFPYEKHAEIDELMNAGGSCIQDLARQAARQRDLINNAAEQAKKGFYGIDRTY